MNFSSEVDGRDNESNTNYGNVGKKFRASIEVFDVVQKDDQDQLTASMALCQKPLCEYADLECVANMVSATICEAITIVESDPRGLFCYKFPKELNFFEVDFGHNIVIQKSSQSDHSASSDIRHNWIKIIDFDYNNVIALIRDLIGQWHLSPDTKCVVLTNTRRHEVAVKGTIYFVDAHFSRPTQRCPNPLAVAKTRFIITVSSVLQPYYPVMITYRFEGYRTLYYAFGERAIKSNTFQRFYIDTILHAKLSFYAEVCECRHGTVAKPKLSTKETKRKSSIACSRK